MYVMVSKKMASELRKYFKDKPPFNKYGFQFDELSERLYALNVDMYPENHENDWQADRGLFKFIRVVYPDDYYAMPRYLTTNDLSRCFRSSDGTFKGFMEQVANEIEI